jgi:hypothetical protein
MNDHNKEALLNSATKDLGERTTHNVGMFEVNGAVRMAAMSKQSYAFNILQKI